MQTHQSKGLTALQFLDGFVDAGDPLHLVGTAVLHADPQLVQRRGDHHAAQKHVTTHLAYEREKNEDKK